MSLAQADTKLDQVIATSSQDILTMRQQNGFWNLSAYLGRHYVSEEFLIYRWLGHQSTSLDENQLKSQILASQLDDGSWYATFDANLTSSGNLDATIINYLALKGLGVSADDPILMHAKTYILKNGGIEASTAFAKAFVCLFGSYSWTKFQTIPMFMFSKRSPISVKKMAVWVAPNLVPIAYLKKMNVARNLGPTFDVRELVLNASDAASALTPHAEARQLKPKAENLIKSILDSQQPQGSWGAYTLSTLLSMAALGDYVTRGTPTTSEAVDADRARALKEMKLAYQFIDTYLSPTSMTAYPGMVMDSRYWDATLLAQSLAQAGLKDKVDGTVKTLVGLQAANGGFLFGADFDYAPDVDDTAEEILLMQSFPGRYQQQVNKAINYLLAMQSQDGGWGAFSKNNKPGLLEKLATHSVKKAGTLFDPPSADVTGHVIEALARSGINESNSVEVRRAVEYVFKKQNQKIHAWKGRWGVNYIYGTAAVVLGLIATGEKPQEPHIERAVQWLISHQNADGGFGETTRSYFKTQYAGVGVSTASQTAWALQTLVAVGQAQSESARKAAHYLLNDFEENGRWIDASVTGGAFPKIMTMVYPSYPYAFSLMALVQYRNALAGTTAPGEKIADQ